jgi:hypothetical protein
LNLEDGKPSSLQLSLSKWPIANNDPLGNSRTVTCTLQGLGLRFSQNIIQFNKLNFDIPQRIAVSSIPTYDGTQTGNIINTEVQFGCTWPGAINPDLTYIPVARKIVAGGSGSTWGDPHLISWDGNDFDFHEFGVFTLFDSNNFGMQVEQIPCGPDNLYSCNSQFALRYGSDIIRFYKTEDNKMKVERRTSNEIKGLILRKLKNKEGYRIFFSDLETVLEITLLFWN